MLAELCCILLTILLLALTGFCVWSFSKLDCDLELVLAEKFGQPIEKLKGKVVWITGASSGVGEHLAYLLAKIGCKVVISGTNRERLDKVRDKCGSFPESSPDNILTLPFNMNDTDCHEEMLKQVLAKFEKLDILVNNAGRSQRAFFQDIDIKVDRELFEINVFSLINLTRVVLRYYMDQNPLGQFAVTSSTAGILGVPCSASYTGSKHALHGYFECLRTELGQRKISIQMLCLGPVFSNIAQSVFTDEIGKKWDGAHEDNSRRMGTDRCAQLIALAMVNKIDQAWIAIQPVLVLHYFTQYYPWLSRKVIPRFFSVERFNKIREGK